MAVMGPMEDRLNFQCPVSDGSAIFVPAGMWHNVINGDFLKSLMKK
jgi:mannose-6-phosphate isomerase-like protein (cupin superfamily)